MANSSSTSPALDNFCGSTFWDLNEVWNTTNPDFSPCFQKTVLVWVPCGVLWLLSPFAIREMSQTAGKRQHHVPWTALNIVKLVLALSLVAIRLVDVTYVLVVQDGDAFPADVWAPCIEAITYVLAFGLILADKYHGVHSSSPLFLFWFFATLAGIVVYRSHLMRVFDDVLYQGRYTFVSTVVSVPMVFAQLVLAAFSDKVVLNKKAVQNSNPYKFASFPSQALFGWFDSLAILGYRRPLKEDDMWALDEEYQSAKVIKDFHEASKNTKDFTENINKGVAHPERLSCGLALWRMYRMEFASAMFLRVISGALTFVSPLMLQELIAFVSNSAAPNWQGYLYAVVIFIGALFGSLSTNNYFFRLQSIGISARAVVIGSVYRKALLMSNAAKRTSTVGEIVNLMSVDAQRLMDVWPYVGYAVTTPFTVAVTLYFLWQLLGASVLIGVGVIIVMVPLNLWLATVTSKLQAKLMKLKDQRTKLMNEILSGIKVLKLYAWELSFYDQVDRIRQKELQMLKKILYLQSTTLFIFQFSPFLIALGTFTTYVLIDENNVLDATKAFVSLSLFEMIRHPLNFVPLEVNLCIQAFVSVRRIDNFLNKDDLDPNQLTIEASKDEKRAAVEIENGTFAWGPEDPPVLSHINFSIPSGSLVAVVGPVGSGKSSLIMSLLGEMEKQSGIITRRGSVAYVAQQAWIQNATLKNNILFGRPMDGVLYQRVLDACALTDDLQMLPGGDQTEIGEKGINLSGGQKQRVSLGRAVYSNTDMYFLDDPLSAVDSHVGKHLFDNVIGPNGILKDKTRLLVTHGISYLPFVDFIMVLKDGVISEIGPYKELLEKGDAFAELIITYLKEVEDVDDFEAEELLQVQEEILPNILNQDNKRKLSLKISKAISSEEENVVAGMSADENKPLLRQRTTSRSVSRHLSVESSGRHHSEKPVADKNNSTLTQVEQMESGSVGWWVYSYYFKSSGWHLFIWCFVVLTVSWACSVGSNVWLSEWSRDTPNPDGSQNILLRDLRLGIYGVLGFGQVFFALLASLILLWAAINGASLLHNDMLLNVLRSPMSFFDTTPLGRIMNRFSRDVDVIDSAIPTFLRPLLDSVLQIIGVVIVICLGTPIFAVVLIPLAITYYLIQAFYILSSRQMKRLESVARSPIFSHFSETLNGISTIRAYGLQNDFTLGSDKRVDLNHTLLYPFLVAKRWLSVRLELVGNLVVFSSALLAVISRNTMDPGSVGLSISYALSVTMVLSWMVRYWTELESSSVSIERMKEYSETHTEAPWKLDNSKPSASWPDEGTVAFKDYSTRYRPGLDLVLKGITCEIQQREKVGIVGRTGAGKSSLALALFRLIEGAGGAIVIDGLEIGKIGLHDLRSRLTIIPQDPVLFFGSLRFNLDPFDKYSDQELWTALEHSHLKDFVTLLPAGLQHEISEGGENLSVGQRQLVCLARALLRKTKVLILDEATAAVDLETDDLIQATIRTEFADCTVLTIAHRLNTIMDSTRVMVLSNGVVQEFDTPTNLLQNNKSSFYSMAKDAGLV